MTDLLAVAVAVLQAAIVATLLVALRRRNYAAAVNALLVLAIAVLPALVEVTTAGGVTVRPAIALWVAAAGLLHSLGMLGLYEREATWWWDHLTHTVSAALVASLVYAGLLVGVARGPGVTLSPPAVAGLTVGFTLAAGAFWELVELVARDVGERFDVEPVLVHYGRRDTALDLVFDAVGAVLVVAADRRVFVPLAEQFPDATRRLVVWSGGGVVVGSVLLAAALVLTDDP